VQKIFRRILPNMPEICFPNIASRLCDAKEIRLAAKYEIIVF